MTSKKIRAAVRVSILFITAFLFVQCGTSKISSSISGVIQNVNPDEAKVIPLPVYDKPTGNTFTLTSTSKIYVEPATDEIINIGNYLKEKLSASTGYPLSVVTAIKDSSLENILLTTENADSSLGDEGYKLIISKDLITLQAYKPAGLFRGIQTLRQLFPVSIESASKMPGPWEIATRIIIDHPRYKWRGAMLDVARHFFSVSDVEKYIDLLAYYKINIFHIHLSDDQGWRIMINSWPNLAKYGGSTSIDGDAGGYYTQKDFSDIVAYAKARYMTVVPEIDMPSHTNAALASYAELNCDGKARSLYTGDDVGFCSLCVDSPETYNFLDDVIKELAAITPGPYIHVGGDEAKTLPIPKYDYFVEKVEKIVHKYGKQMIGWEEISNADLTPGTISQFWVNDSLALKAVKDGIKLIMSPAPKIYLDMKYDASTKLGQDWAGYINVKTSYDWDPAELVKGITDKNIIGVEAPVWTETLKTLSDVEYMAFPRIVCSAEIGWTPAAKKNWNDFEYRLLVQQERWDVMKINYYKIPDKRLN